VFVEQPIGEQTMVWFAILLWTSDADLRPLDGAKARFRINVFFQNMIQKQFIDRISLRQSEKICEYARVSETRGPTVQL